MNARVVFRGFTSLRPFGVELEVSEKVSKPEIKKVVVAVDPKHPVHIEGGGGWAKSIEGDVWHIKRDGTCGHEIATYKMIGYQDIQNVGNVADALRRRGCQVNEKCGLHVHADLSDFSTSMMGVMLGYWLKIEHVLLQACPLHRRHNKHCRNMRQKYNIDQHNFDNADTLYAHLEPSNLKDHDNEDKRITLNFVPYVIHRYNPGFKKNTAEIRMPEGTLVKSDVQNWVRLYLHFVEAVKLRLFPENLDKVGLKETLQILDLHGTDQSFYLLGKDLYSTKKWFLRRVATYTDDPILHGDAMSFLNQMSQPLENHTRLNRVFPILEATSVE